LLEAVLAEIARFKVADDVELTSSHVPLLARARQMAPPVRTGLFVRPWPDWMGPALGRAHVLGWMGLLEARVAHLPASLLEAAFVRQLQAQGYRVHGANLNTEEEMVLGCRLGLDQFSTDRLELALDVRGRMGSQRQS
jgi:glycerophosphoryl diester phosphodiesterase